MLLHALPITLPRNTQWILFEDRSYERTYISVEDITIEGQSLQWKLSSPFTYGFFLLTTWPSHADREALIKNQKMAFILCDKKLFLLDCHSGAYVIISQDPMIIKTINDYLYTSNLLTSSQTCHRLTVLDLATFALITDYNVFQHSQSMTRSLYQPSRLTQIWNLINPRSYPAYDLNYAWLSPYVAGDLLTDQEMIDRLMYYYQTHRIIQFHPFEQAMVQVDKDVICLDVAHILQYDLPGNSTYIQQLHDTNSRLSQQFSTHYEKPVNKEIGDHILNLLYLERALNQEYIFNQYVTVQLSRKITFFRKKQCMMPLATYVLLINISQYEIQDKNPVNVWQDGLLFDKLQTEYYTSILHYIISEKPQYFVEVLNKLSQSHELKQELLKRNKAGQNIYDMVLMYSPQHLKSLLEYSIHLLSDDEQKEFLKQHAQGRYQTIFEYTSVEQPDLWNVLDFTAIKGYQNLSSAVLISNNILFALKITPLLHQLEKELARCKSKNELCGQFKALDVFYQAMLGIRYDLMYKHAHKNFPDQFNLLKRACRAAFQAADAQLIYHYYYWERYSIINQIFSSSAFMDQYKATKAALDKENIQIAELGNDSVLVNKM